MDPKGIERAQANPESRREVEPPALTYEQSFVQRIIDLSRDVAKCVGSYISMYLLF